jgi:cell division protein FtsB
VSAAPLHVVPNPESRAKPDKKHGAKKDSKSDTKPEQKQKGAG